MNQQQQMKAENDNEDTPSVIVLDDDDEKEARSNENPPDSPLSTFDVKEGWAMEDMVQYFEDKSKSELTHVAPNILNSVGDVDRNAVEKIYQQIKVSRYLSFIF